MTTTTTTTKRFVNLGRARTSVPGPDGHAVTVHPFADALNPRVRKDGATYILEGEFWEKYARGEFSQLRPFPRPSQYGRTSFPPLEARHDDGRLVPVVADDVDAPASQVEAQAGPGKYRLAGDVITPEGKIRRTLPSGEVTLVDDTPENRNMVHSAAGVVNERNPQVRDGIMRWLVDMHVETYADFASLSDEVLCKIPGVTSATVGAIRENIGRYMRAAEDLEQPEVTPVGETAQSAVHPKSIDEVLSDEVGAAPPKAPARKRAKKKVKKKPARRSAAD